MVAKDIFSFATVPDGCEEANFIGFFHENGILDTTFGKVSQKKVDFSEQFHEIDLFATVSHGSKVENILRNHDSWLPRRNNL